MELKDLTLKQRRWLQCFCEFDSETFGNATKSAIVAYELGGDEQYHSARQVGWENMTKLDIQIGDLMNEMGLSNTKLVSKLSEGLEASKRYGNDATMHPDNNARLKALELALKLKGILSDKIEVSKGFFSDNKLEIVVVKNETELDQLNSITVGQQ